jgi:L-alanine-DL-glutamate epimerase-like enolase superfamily enzyme
MSGTTDRSPTVATIAPLAPAPGAPPDHASTNPSESFAERLQHIAANIVLLKVTTVVGTLTGAVSADDLHTVTTITLDPANQQIASLSMNMALGDTSQLMSPDFIANKDYRDLHADAIKQAREVRQETVTLISTMIKEFGDWLKK